MAAAFSAKNSACVSISMAIILPGQGASQTRSRTLALCAQSCGLMAAARFGGAGLGLGPVVALDADLTLARETFVARPKGMLRASPVCGQGAARPFTPLV